MNTPLHLAETLLVSTSADRTAIMVQIIASFATMLIALFTWLTSRNNGAAIQRVKISIDGRMEELLSAARGQAKAEGKETGRNEAEAKADAKADAAKKE